MSTSTEIMLQLKVEETERAGRMVERQLRKFLAGALCSECGEPLGEEEEIVQDDDERTLHARCKKQPSTNED